MNSVELCTCTNLKCPFHPTNQDEGCTPCIEKNLKFREIPSCFFNMVPGSENRMSFFFEDFAELVMNAEKNGNL